jgi:hypothetical protein
MAGEWSAISKAALSPVLQLKNKTNRTNGTNSKKRDVTRWRINQTSQAPV